MIDDFKKVEKLFKEINDSMQNKVKVYVIGGAALLSRGMKPATKDIDLVVATKHEFIEIQKGLNAIDFKPQITEKEYVRMNISQIFQRDDFRIDLFEKEVCGKFSLSENMIKRAEELIKLSYISIFLCSNEDVFLFKTMTEREGDITDCISIATTQDPEWSIILEELKSQVKYSKQDVWITWVGERFDILEEKGLKIPIMKDLNMLRKKFYKDYEKKT